MQKLMREMENWRQSMLKAAGLTMGPGISSLPPLAGSTAPRPTPGLEMTSEAPSTFDDPFAETPPEVLSVGGEARMPTIGGAPVREPGIPGHLPPARPPITGTPAAERPHRGGRAPSMYGTYYEGLGERIDPSKIPGGTQFEDLENPEDFGLEPHEPGYWSTTSGPRDRYIKGRNGEVYFMPWEQQQAEGKARQDAARGISAAEAQRIQEQQRKRDALVRRNSGIDKLKAKREKARAVQEAQQKKNEEFYSGLNHMIPPGGHISSDGTTIFDKNGVPIGRNDHGKFISVADDITAEDGAPGAPSGTGLPDHGFMPSPVPPVGADSAKWSILGANAGRGAAIGTGVGGLLGGGLGYALGGKDKKLLSTLLGTGLGMGGGALLGGLGGAYFGKK